MISAIAEYKNIKPLNFIESAVVLILSLEKYPCTVNLNVAKSGSSVKNNNFISVTTIFVESVFKYISNIIFSQLKVGKCNLII